MPTRATYILTLAPCSRLLQGEHNHAALLKHPVIDSTGKVAGKVERDMSECSQIVYKFCFFPTIQVTNKSFPLELELDLP